MSNTCEVVYNEIYGNNEDEKIFVKSDKKFTVHSLKKWSIKSLLSFSYFKLFLTEVFLPKDFPDSVSSDYIPYQIWDTVQAFASTILGALTTHSVLIGVGVGESAATPLAAAISWILKDGSGMVGRIIFAWWKGSELDAQIKKWRLFADILNDLAMGIELTLPYFTAPWVTGILCISTIMKSLVGVAGGATRAALMQHQALTNNLADVSAKDSSQETFVNLVASFVGIYLLSTFQQTFLIEMYLMLVTVHIYANYSAVRALKLNTLNEDRLSLIMNNYMMNETILNVEQANKQESLFLLQTSSKKLCGFKIELGISLSKVLGNSSINSTAYLGVLINHFRDKKFLIIPDIDRETIYIALKKDIQAIDVLNAYFCGYIYGLVMSLQLKKRHDISEKAQFFISTHLAKLNSTNEVLKKFPNNEIPLKIILSSDKLMSEAFDDWYKLLIPSEWIHTETLLSTSNWRGQWNF